MVRIADPAVMVVKRGRRGKGGRGNEEKEQKKMSHQDVSG
jgi:hypothetical protein